MNYFNLISKFIVLSVFLWAVNAVVLSQNNSQSLTPNQNIEREMTGTETHRYKFDLKRDEFFQVRVDQKGVDVDLKLIDEEGETLARMDSPNDNIGVEILTFIPKKNGIYKLEIISYNEKAEKGIYTIKRENSRTAVIEDKRRVEVEKLFVGAVLSFNELEKSGEIIDQLEIVLKGWQELNDEYLINLTNKFVERIKQLVNKKANELAVEAQKLFNQQTLDSLSKSKEKFENVSTLCSIINNYKCLIVSAIQLARVAEFFNDSAEALRKYEQVLSLVQIEKNEALEALSLNNIGTIYIKFNDNLKAIEYFEKSLRIIRKARVTELEIKTLNNLGEAHNRLGEKGKAIEYYKQALELNQNVDQKQKIESLSKLANLHLEVERIDQALEYLRQLLPVAEELKDTDLKVLTLAQLGIANANLGNYQAGTEYISQAELLITNVQDKAKKAISLNFISLVNLRLGKTKAALSYSEQSLEIIASIENKDGEALALVISGGSFMYLGEMAKAQKNLNKALEISIGNGDKTSQALSLNLIGTIILSQGNKEDAQKYFEQALSIAKEMGNKSIQAESLNMMGMNSLGTGDYPRALEYLQQSLSIAKEIGDKSNEAFALNLTAGCFISLGKLKEALEKSQQSAEIAQNSGDKRHYALALIFSGIVLEKLGEKQKAIHNFQQALAIGTEAEDKRNISLALLYLGSISFQIGEHNKAQQYFEQSLTITSETKDKSSQSLALNYLGGFYLETGERSKGISYLERSLSISKEIDDKNNQGRALISLGKAFGGNDNSKSLNYLNEALKIAETTKDKPNLGKTLLGIGGFYFLKGESNKALDYAQRVLPIVEETGDKTLELERIILLGMAYSALGQQDEAIKYLNDALLLSKETRSKEYESFALAGLARAYLLSGKTSEAENYVNESLKISRESKYKASEATALSILGFLSISSSKTEKALEIFQQCLEIAETIGHNGIKSLSLNNIGIIYGKLKQNRKALEYFNKALIVRFDYKNQKAMLLSNEMYIWETLENTDLAISYGKYAVNTFQELRTNLQGTNTNLQKSFLTSIEEVYRFLANLLIKQGRVAEAQQVLNSFKDQQFFDFDKSHLKEPLQLVFIPREEEFILLYGKTTEKVGEINSNLEEQKRFIGNRPPTADETAQIKKLEADLKTATDDFLTALKQAETKFSTPPDEKDKIGDVPDTREMQTTLGNLNQQTNQKTVAVYTLVGEDIFWALIVSPDGIKAVSSPIKGTELNDKALKLWGLLQSDKYDTTVLSKQIYDVVFKPIEAGLPKDTTTIMWSLDGNLRYIPMSALWDGNKFLAERYNHVIFTRADSERLTRNVNPNWTGTGFGTIQPQTVELLGSKIPFSALPGVKEELAEIFKSNGSLKGILTGEVLPDAKFTKANFIESLKRKRPVVHIASHFSFRPGDEARSFLLLGDGTPFTLNDMKKETNLFEGVDLLTLSACNTAATQQDANGREIDGFAELAQRLGAGAVMATLWQVSDASTPWLMREFYENRQSEKLTKAEALRKAQLALLSGTAKTSSNGEVVTETANTVKVVIKENAEKTTDNLNRGAEIVVSSKDAPLFKKDVKKEFAHPYYWSPFVVFGNWK